MIFKILDAYEEEIRKEDSFFKKIAKATKVNIVFGVLIITFILGTIPIWYFFKNIYLMVCYMLLCMVVDFVATEIQSKDRRKNYIKNVNEYNRRLDCLKKLLMKEEFSICSAKKLMTLINKINKYLEDTNNSIKQRKQNRKELYSNIIIPIGAFVLGTLATELKIEEIVVSAIGLILFIL